MAVMTKGQKRKLEWLKLGLYYKKGTSGSPSAMKSLRSLCLCVGVVYVGRRGVNERGKG